MFIWQSVAVVQDTIFEKMYCGANAHLVSVAFLQCCRIQIAFFFFFMFLWSVHTLGRSSCFYCYYMHVSSLSTVEKISQSMELFINLFFTMKT